MDFSNSTTEDGLIQEVDRICSTSDTTYSLKAKTSRINQAIDRFFALIFKYDKTFRYDDSNHTDEPIGEADLTNTDQNYSFAAEVLSITDLTIKDPNGNDIVLVEDNTVQPTTKTGVPSKYKLIGNSIWLDVIPSYNYTAGLRVGFRRNGSKFVSTDTTKDPGIPTLFHLFLCRYAALPYLVKAKLPQKNDVAAQIKEDEMAIREFIANRNTAKPSGMRTNQESNR